MLFTSWYPVRRWFLRHRRIAVVMHNEMAMELNNVTMATIHVSLGSCSGGSTILPPKPFVPVSFEVWSMFAFRTSIISPIGVVPFEGLASSSWSPDITSSVAVLFGWCLRLDDDFSVVAGAVVAVVVVDAAADISLGIAYGLLTEAFVFVCDEVFPVVDPSVLSSSTFLSTVTVFVLYPLVESSSTSFSTVTLTFRRWFLSWLICPGRYLWDSKVVRVLAVEPSPVANTIGINMVDRPNNFILAKKFKKSDKVWTIDRGLYSSAGKRQRDVKCRLYFVVFWDDTRLLFRRRFAST